jgi:heptosyltransferase-2
VLVLRGGALGDFVLTLPALALLRSAFPGARIELIAHPGIGSLANPPYVERVLSIESAALAGFFVRDAELDSALSTYVGGFDCVVSYLHDPEGVFESNVRRCGVSVFIRAFGFPADRHAALQWGEPLRQLGLVLASSESRIELCELDYKDCEIRARQAGQFPLLAVHPGSGSPRKNWPLEHWLELLEYFLEKWPSGGLRIIGGEADRAQISLLRSAFSRLDARVEMWEDVAHRTLAARLSLCDFFVGHDSGVSHVAVAVQTPSLLLFGPTDPAVWAPTGTRVRILQSRNLLMGGLDVKEVREALEDALGKIHSCQSGALSGE